MTYSTKQVEVNEKEEYKKSSSLMPPSNLSFYVVDNCL